MLTYKYVRPLSADSGSGASFDSYNPLVHSPDAPQEYWTNGTVFHVQTPGSSTAWLSSSSLSSSNMKGNNNNNSPVSRKRILRHHETNNNNIARNSVLAGSGAGIVSTLLLFPADVVRTKMQSSTGTAKGPFQVFQHTLRHGGLRALYTGLSLPLAAQAVYKSTVFCVNNVTQQLLLDHRRLEHEKLGNSTQEVSLSLTDYFISGFVGGAVNAAAFVTPVEFVRNQMIAQHSQMTALAASSSTSSTLKNPVFRVSTDVIRYAWQSQHGLHTLWRGLGWTITRDAVGCGCFFVSMKVTQDLLMTQYYQGQPPPFAVTIVSGGVAGLAFWLAALPLDTVKTWVQSSTDWKVHVSPNDTVKGIYREGGVPAVTGRLFRGWQVAYGRGIPSAAITIAVYSMVYRYLENVE